MFSIDQKQKFRMWRHGIRAGVVMAFMSVLVIAGCGQKRIEVKEDLPQLPPVSTLIAPGDELYIEFFNNAELTNEHVVRPDGKIMLQLIGEVQASGKTPGDLTKEIEQRYEGLLRQPKVAISILNQPEQVVYVAGEVVAPGEIPLRERISIIQAIMQAGGFDTRRADMSRVMLIRYSSGKRHMQTYDMKALLDGKDVLGGTTFLEPGDIVYVPKRMSAE
ncbi:polysaccharide biosynthesis/export family protein [Desulfocurvibacter africanus]|uniref:polysaccharide biosynthesis/export family protein n=1 Tax=Desulfocurvibacter africanus TaxID=873 RepID=UPI0004834D14|nr:polysaccharide biosynthesis/export family protein [Desulfocurvibacter africanus]